MLTEIYQYIFRKSALLLNRHQLGSISLDTRNKELSEEEKKARNISIANSFKYIEPAIKKLIIAQQEFMAKQCENEQQLLFARGTINGLFIIREELQSYKSAHDEENKPKENYDEHQIF